MGFFDAFRKKNTEPAAVSPAQEHLLRAQEHYNSQNYREALRSLASGFAADAAWAPLYSLSVSSLEKLGAPEEAALFRAALDAPQNPSVFKALADHFMEETHYSLATAFFERHLLLAPDNQEILHDLAICYARRFQVQKALGIMESLKGNDFWDSYFRNKCRILANDTAKVQADLESMSNLLANHPDEEEVYWPKTKTRELIDMLRRLQTIPEPRTHIQDWHFVHYGSVILEYFDSDEYVAGGRYVALWGSFNAVKGIARQLRTFAEKLSVQIDHVAALDDRDSEITGRIIARELGLDFCTYHPEGAHHNALIVAGDAVELGRYEELNTARNGQLLFALNLGWMNSAYICPDICGYISQYYYFPWNKGCFRMNEDTQKMEEIPADLRSAEEIAEDIYKEQPEETEAAKYYDFYAERRAFLKGIGDTGDSFRHSFVTESPVPGAYFGM